MKIELTVKVVEGNAEEIAALVKAVQAALSHKTSVTVSISPALVTGLRVERRKKAQSVIAVLDDAKRKLLEQKVEEVLGEMSVRLAHCLVSEQLVYIGSLVRYKESEILRIPNMGKNSLKELKNLLTSLGLSLEMDVGDWQPPRAE